MFLAWAEGPYSAIGIGVPAMAPGFWHGAKTSSGIVAVPANEFIICCLIIDLMPE
jgi:hypothetical protein